MQNLQLVQEAAQELYKNKAGQIVALDVQGIAITSYQGGHVEFFKYMIDLLKANGGENIKVFGGGGGVIGHGARLCRVPGGQRRAAAGRVDWGRADSASVGDAGSSTSESNIG